MPLVVVGRSRDGSLRVAAMKRSKLMGRFALVAVLAFAALMPPVVEAQNSRVGYLIRLLGTSDTFRVRAQAAISLGRVEASSEVVTALSNALGDDHPAVRTAAAASLERLADPSALPALRRIRRDRESSVRRAVASAIRTLERVARTRPQNNDNDNANQGGGGPAQFYVGVGQPGDRAGVDRATVRRALEFLRREVGGMDGVRVAPDGETNSAARRAIQRGNLTGYYIDSSIVSVDTSGGNTRVTVSVILNTYPGRDMRAILQGAATVPGATGASATQTALEGALRGALRRLPQAMAASRR